MNALVIEDDRKIARFVSDGLQGAGFLVNRTKDGLKGELMARSGIYAVAIVDLMLPGQDGLTLIQNLRRAKIEMPVIVLSAKRSLADKVICLQRGADDYLAKPFDFPELLARIEAILRRTSGVPESERLEGAGVTLDLVGRTVHREGQRIDLTPREFALLELLMRRAGCPLARPYLLERLWGYTYELPTNLVQVLVSRLRDRVDHGFRMKLIHTVRGIGYVFLPR